MGNGQCRATMLPKCTSWMIFCVLMTENTTWKFVVFLCWLGSMPVQSLWWAVTCPPSMKRWSLDNVMMWQSSWWYTDDFPASQWASMLLHHVLTINMLLSHAMTQLWWWLTLPLGIAICNGQKKAAILFYWLMRTILMFVWWKLDKTDVAAFQCGW